MNDHRELVITVLVLVKGHWSVQVWKIIPVTFSETKEFDLLKKFKLFLEIFDVILTPFELVKQACFALSSTARDSVFVWHVISRDATP